MSEQALIVDDNPGNRKLLFFALAPRHYQLHQANTGSEARAIIETVSLHMALLDVELPDINGMELAKEIRRRTPNTLIVMLSANDTNETLSEALTAGANAYVVKPYNLRAVLELIRQLEAHPVEPYTNMLMLHNDSKRVTRYLTVQSQDMSRGAKHDDPPFKNSVDDHAGDDIGRAVGSLRR